MKDRVSNFKFKAEKQVYGSNIDYGLIRASGGVIGTLFPPEWHSGIEAVSKQLYPNQDHPIFYELLYHRFDTVVIQLQFSAPF